MNLDYLYGRMHDQVPRDLFDKVAQHVLREQNIQSLFQHSPAALIITRTLAGKQLTGREIVKECGMAQARVWHNLKALRQLGVVVPLKEKRKTISRPASVFTLCADWVEPEFQPSVLGRESRKKNLNPLWSWL